MASLPGSQYVFFDNNPSGIRISLTSDGSDLPAPVAGETNIELFTTTPGSLAPGYQGSAFAYGASASGRVIFGPSTLQLLAGDYGVKDLTGGNTIAEGTGNQTVIGAAGDTIIAGSGAVHIEAANVLLALGDAPTTVSGAQGDTSSPVPARPLSTPPSAAYR